MNNIVMNFCNSKKNEGILVDAKHINVNGKYGPIVYEKWEIWSDFPCMRKPSIIQNSNIQNSNKTTKAYWAHFRKEKKLYLSRFNSKLSRINA